MTDNLRAWAAHLRISWTGALMSLRSGIFGTSELRNGRRIDTTMETIVRKKRELLALDAAIVRHDQELKDSLKLGDDEHHLQ
jgi:hypothetical protein